METLLLCGTKKGLFIFDSSDRAQWQPRGPFLRGKEVFHATRDPRTGRIFAAANDAWFGSEIVFTDDLGETWTSATKNPIFAEDSELKLERIWHIEPGAASEPGVLYAGVAPAALFRSEDSGASWHTANRGTRAEFFPEKYPEFGQCVHKLLISPADSGLLFQQNHCGVYRSSNSGVSWDEISAGLPSDFGFPLALHPREPRTLYVLPLQGGEFRCPPEAKLRVFRSRDAGDHWEALTSGLPQEQAFGGVLREGMAADAGDPAGIYFGTNTGKLFASIDDGDSWRELAGNLPPICSISVSSISS